MKEKAERHYPEDGFSKQIEQLRKSMDMIAKWSYWNHRIKLKRRNDICD